MTGLVWDACCLWDVTAVHDDSFVQFITNKSRKMKGRGFSQGDDNMREMSASFTVSGILGNLLDNIVSLIRFVRIYIT